MSSLLDSRSTDHPLLGYDWIAGILDNGPVLSDKSEDYFEAIKHFRRDNREECIGSGELELVNFSLHCAIGGLISVTKNPTETQALINLIYYYCF